MPDFSQLLRKPAGQAVKPPALPAGDYPAIIKSHELGESQQKKTPYVRFHIGLMGWPDSIGESDRVMPGSDGSTHPIDLAKKQLRRDFFFTEDAMWRLDDFIRSLGIQAKGRTYEEVLPECVGAHVVASVKQSMNQNTNDIFNEVDKLVGAA